MQSVLKFIIYILKQNKLNFNFCYENKNKKLTRNKLAVYETVTLVVKFLYNTRKTYLMSRNT